MSKDGKSRKSNVLESWSYDHNKNKNKKIKIFIFNLLSIMFKNKTKFFEVCILTVS